MADSTTRRLYLLAAIQRHGAPVTTQAAVDLMRTSPWATTGRNTARKDLRALVLRGHLTAFAMADGRCAYRCAPCCQEVVLGA